MEKISDLMKGLNLSEAEKKKVCIGGGSVVPARTGSDPQKAFCRLLSEKSVWAEVIEQAVGWIWCPVRGVECKDLGDNFFLITFGQAAGKRKALDEGPWMVSNELLVVADFDGSKTLDEIVFAYIPIWVRVGNLPMGLMNADTARVLGDEVGEFMEMEAEGDAGEIVAGRYLWIKVKLDIRKPLMRGVTVSPGEGLEDRWCPLSYEFLPDFCYCCGIIGHTDKVCQLNVGKKMEKAFGRELRYIPPKRRPGGAGGSLTGWRGAGSGGGRGISGSGGGWTGSRSSGGKSRSDAPSWRKSPNRAQGKEKGKAEEEEVISPMKIAGTTDLSSSPVLVAKKKLEMKVGEEVGEGEGEGEVADKVDVNSTMQIMQGMSGEPKEGEKIEEKKSRKFKRVPRGKEATPSEKETASGRKRGLGEPMEIDKELALKKAKVGGGDEAVASSTNEKAGLSEQLRGDQ